MPAKMDKCACGRTKRAKFDFCNRCFSTRIRIEYPINEFNFNALMEAVQHNCIGTTDGHRIFIAGKVGDVS